MNPTPGRIKIDSAAEKLRTKSHRELTAHCLRRTFHPNYQIRGRLGSLMYSWKQIRIACSVLLLLPLVHLTYLLSQSTMATLNASPDTWANEIEAYVAADTAAVLPAQPIVVVGGQRVKLWHDLEREMAPQPVLMRGLGDAIVEDITFNYARLIGYYQPDAVVLLPSNSEFFIRDNKSAQELADAIAELVALDRYHDTTRHFYIFTPIKTPLRPQDYATIKAATLLLEALARTDERIVLLDANTLLTSPDGKPRGHYFRSDGLNLNEHGYLRLSVLLKAQMEANTTDQTALSATP